MCGAVLQLMCGWEERGPCSSVWLSLPFVCWSLCQCQINYRNTRVGARLIAQRPSSLLYTQRGPKLGSKTQMYLWSTAKTEYMSNGYLHR
ncbi:hypothetical protein LX32DRAFT_335451 [Colletotrichum zoysiae]|uniref:Uncharacterized protein n=1 Tax=Colletotrichum zoysiae TaxID=1216348 RepID=A0AAD9M117_9PEZI|nr:hypothetical protein LX32DRAFT_335451 [Colletotrichum zoysiae]